jgi:hypothetical protein
MQTKGETIHPTFFTSFGSLFSSLMFYQEKNDLSRKSVES